MGIFDIDARSPEVKVKLCGMFRVKDIQAVNAAKPDMVGFIINVPRSHRTVDEETLKELSGLVDSRITRVGVFVDEPVSEVARLVQAGYIDAVQLHGSEDDEYISQLRCMCEAPIIQAFKIRRPEDVVRAEGSSADMVLLDSGAGSGDVFDWSYVSQVTRPFMLAGGLGVDNLAAALAEVRPWGVDLSSGLETDRRKDPKKIREVVQIVRNHRN